MSFFSDKTILITGSTGLIGSNLVNTLMNIERVKVIVLSRNEEKIKKCFNEHIGKENFKYIAQDISLGLDSIKDNIDICFHGAGSMEGKVISNTPVDIIMPNLIGTKNCCDFLVNQYKNKNIRGRLILFSSVTVYGNNTDKDLCVKEEETNYTDILEAKNACYSQSKRMVEVIAHSYKKQFNIDFVTARFSTVYGSTKVIPDTAFFEFIRKSIKGEDISINGLGLPKRDNIYIDDAVNALLTICEKGISGEAYNISSNNEKGNFLAIDEIASIIAEVSNSYFNRKEEKVSVILKDKNPKRNPGLMLNNEKLKSLGWELKVNFEEGIQKTLENIDIVDK